ncbi:MAG TPA: serine protease, partial [Burkholderiales bacterium]|nr:serine protease [Burkholderiales bacterium]
ACLLLSAAAAAASSPPAPAAGIDWQLFASGSTAKVYFDRASLREADPYLHFRMRIEYSSPRTSRDRRQRYSSAISEMAAECATRRVAIVSAVLYDETGLPLRETTRTPERWQQALAPAGTDSLQARLLAHACALARGENPAPPAARSAASVRIGAGVVVTADGLVLTNHHVAQDCDALSVRDDAERSSKARVVGVDVANDLALLQAERKFAKAASFRRGAPLQAGESVTVVGFPLAALLGFEPSVTFGYVTAVGGLRGDASRFQISAPIHKGNSGGPILDQSGQVIGVVTAKLNALAVQKRMGDLPQNISFGVKGDVALAFLESHAARVRSAADGPKLENTEVAAIGREVTVLVACRHSRKSAP